MSWYGLGSIACSGTTVTGTGTKWKDNKLGIGAGQALLIPGSGTVKIYEIKSVDSDTKITLVSSPGTIAAGQAYAIMSFYTDSVPDFARRLSAQLSYYQSQMDGWQQILTGTGDITLTAPDNTTVVVIPSMSKLTNWVTDLKNLGIGLPGMTTITNFDWQTFVFASGASYLSNSGSWINTPSGVVYGNYTIGMSVNYITGTSVSLTLRPNTVSNTNFKVYEVIVTGYAGSRVFTVRETQTSANPVPISCGGTGSPTAAGALAALGLTDIGIGLPSMTTIANFDFQKFVFTSGANYIATSSSWLNAPPEVSYPGAGLAVSINVDYTSGTTIGLTLVPSTVVDSGFKVYRIRITGAIGSRLFAVRQDWNSAIPVPISGGGTGAPTPDGSRENLGFAGMGIGLTTLTGLTVLDWQQQDFLTGSNYFTNCNVWSNTPAGVVYNAGTGVSIAVDYISGNSSKRIGLTLTPDTSLNTNYVIYKILIIGDKGSRTFTYRKIQNSAIPVAIEDGGTGATTPAGAIATLGLGEGSLAPIGVPLLYPSAAPVTSGYLKCNASPFSKTIYPRLAAVYPSGVTPDVRSDNTAFIYIIRAL